MSINCKKKKQETNYIDIEAPRNTMQLTHLSVDLIHFFPVIYFQLKTVDKSDVGFISETNVYESMQ